MTNALFTSSARPRAFRRLAAPAATAALALALSAGVGEFQAAHASAPVTPPVFTTPLNITNTFSPFEVGAVKVYAGRSEGTRVTVVDLYLATTREFLVDSTTVECRTLQEMEFEGGELVEISLNWFAQADDGTVWYFGETVDEYEDGQVVSNGGSWLVGGPGAGDPPGTMTVAAPAVFMPGNPEVGDEYSPENLPDGSQELNTVRRTGRTVKTPGGRFEGCIEVREFHLPDEEYETKWWAPGVGVVLEKAKGEKLVLLSSTLRGAGE